MSRLLELSQSLEEVAFAPGEVLLQEGTTSGNLFIMTEGAVEISKQGSPIKILRQPGTLLGEVSLLLDGPHVVSVTAVQPTRCRVTRGGRDYLASNAELSLLVAEVLALRLKGMIGYLADLKEQYGDRSDSLGVVDEVLDTLAHLQLKH
jgi:CRP-like cAMP-binding protein